MAAVADAIVKKLFPDGRLINTDEVFRIGGHRSELNSKSHYDDILKELNRKEKSWPINTSWDLREIMKIPSRSN